MLRTLPHSALERNDLSRDHSTFHKVDTVPPVALIQNKKSAEQLKSRPQCKCHLADLFGEVHSDLDRVIGGFLKQHRQQLQRQQLVRHLKTSVSRESMAGLH